MISSSAVWDTLSVSVMSGDFPTSATRMEVVSVTEPHVKGFNVGTMGSSKTFHSCVDHTTCHMNLDFVPILSPLCYKNVDCILLDLMYRNIYIFTAIALDETTILVAVHFWM